MTAPSLRADLDTLSQPQRQSLLAAVFQALRVIRQIGIAQVIVGLVFLSNAPIPGGVFVLVPAIGLLLLAIGVALWWRYTFHVADGELVVRRGLVSDDRLSVPLDRVQSVSIEQQLLHRLVGLVQVSVDTAGSDAAEFVIDAVPRTTAEALQRLAASERSEVSNAITGDGGEPPSPVADEATIVSHTWQRLLTMSVTQWPVAGVIVIGPLLAFGNELVDLLPFDIAAPDLDLDPGLWMLWLIPVGIAVITLAGVLLNIVQLALTEWNLTVTASASGFRRTAGLLSRTSRASSIPRVQRLVEHQNVLEQRVGLRRFTLHTIGTGDIQVPGCTEAEADELHRRAFGGCSPALDRRISAKSAFLPIRNTAVITVLVMAAAARPLGWWVLLGLVIPLWVAFTERHRVARHRWGVDGHGWIDRRDMFALRTEQSLHRKVNRVRVTQSRYARRRGLATVVLATAEGSTSIGLIPVDEAQALRDLVLAEVEQDRRPWM